MDDQRMIVEKDHLFVSNNNLVDQQGPGSDEIGDDKMKKEKGVLVLDDGNDVGKDELNKDDRVSIDVKLDVVDGKEMVCRICHLNSDQSPQRDDGKMKECGVLIELGCGCKDDLGLAHSHCAEAWFKLKGNRICEICGDAARNITGIIQEPSLVVEWNDRRSYANDGSYPTERQDTWCRGQPCCNLLMACLIVAFVLPWFFRVKIV